jgi:hypothetical protein
VLKTFGFKSSRSSYPRGIRTTAPLHRLRRKLGTRRRGGRTRARTQGIAYKTIPGEAAFYGPKIDVKLIDVLGRLWQLSTVQFDFNLPARFELEYVGEDGERHQPVMVHRALFGSVERFFGVLIEHYAGAFPLWLAPVQVGLVPISERHHAYAKKVEAELKAAGLRVEVDDRNEKMNGKIRDFANQKTPYILVFGDKEEAGNASASAPAAKATRAPCRSPTSSRSGAATWQFRLSLSAFGARRPREGRKNLSKARFYKPRWRPYRRLPMFLKKASFWRNSIQKFAWRQTVLARASQLRGSASLPTPE